MLRLSGTGVTYFSGETSLQELENVSKEVAENLSYIKYKLNELQSPKSMHHVVETYMESINNYEKSVRYFQNFASNEDLDSLNKYINLSNQTNENIKYVNFELWRDEYNPN